MACLQSAASAQQAAQEPVDYQAHIDAAASQLRTLDSKAGACLTAFEAESTESAAWSCREFLGAIDGPAMESEEGGVGKISMPGFRRGREGWTEGVGEAAEQVAKAVVEFQRRGKPDGH